jgi:hypothetical protein
VATLDQLPPDRRAIIELVLERGQSYEDLSETLGMPEPRVREHAREALVSLAPRTAERVDPQWRGQVADYVLGQQSGPQAKATRSHLKGSEPARTWALSVLDSVGHLFPNGAEPTIPAGGRGSTDGERKGRGGGAAAAGAGAAAAAAGGEERQEPGRAREAGSAGGAATADRPMSEEARALVRRRRIIAAAGAAVVIVVAVLLITGVLAGDDEPADAGGTADTASAEPAVLAQIALEPVGRSNGAGAAIIAEREGQTVLLMQGRLPPPAKDEAYVVWLYNSPDDAVAVAGPQIDNRGNFQAVGPLPEDYERYESLDVSVQQRSNREDRRNHSGTSLLRGPVAGTAELTGAAPEGGELPAPEELTPPDDTQLPAPEELTPPDDTQLPDPGSLPTVPEG